MTHRLSTRLLAVLLPAAALLLPAAAHAEKVVTEDAVGDAQKVNWAQADVETDPLFLPAPDETSTDITRTVAAHGAKRLSITVHFSDLVRVTEHATFVRVHTPSQGQFGLGLDKEPGSKASVSLATRSAYVECGGLRGTIDREADLVSLSVPTACIGDPRWVQLSVRAFGATVPADDQDPFDFDLFADDGHRDGTISQNTLAKGPRIRRG